VIVDVAGHPVYAYTGTRPLDAAQPTVVFVHGAANDHSVWALQSRYFAHHGRNVLAVDLPSHGRSGGAALPSVEAIADWIGTLLDAAGIATAALVGHSLGSLAVLAAAARHPGRVTRLALVGTIVPMPVSDVLLDAARADDHVAFELINGWSYSAGKQLGGNPVPGMWMTGTGLRLMERTRRGVLYADLAACNAYAGGLDAATAVSCPALLVLGARDLMAPPKGAQALVAALRDRRVVTLPDCGHALMAEQPDAVLDALAAFLAR
jgi:pimeloyl-ACP methyl ester carboxylesterase